MKRNLASLLAVLLLMLFSIAIQAAVGDEGEDTDTRISGARVVEVAEAHISVMARSGVEHVIAVSSAGTKVTIDGEVVSLKDVREGDVATVELDEQREVKFAKNISMRSSQIARVRR